MLRDYLNFVAFELGPFIGKWLLKSFVVLRGEGKGELAIVFKQYAIVSIVVSFLSKILRGQQCLRGGQNSFRVAPHCSRL